MIPFDASYYGVRLLMWVLRPFAAFEDFLVALGITRDARDARDRQADKEAA